MNVWSSFSLKNLLITILIIFFAIWGNFSLTAQSPGVNPSNSSFQSDIGKTSYLAAFTVSEITPLVDKSVMFNAANPDGSNMQWKWDFDDGTTATGKKVTHVFAARGDYKVTLTVTDDNIPGDRECIWIFVGRPAGWARETHRKSAGCMYDILFDDSKVQRIDIIIDPAVYRSMEKDVAAYKPGSSVDPKYVPVTVKYDGHTWWKVGMRYKGNSTLIMARDRGHKLPFRLYFDKFEDDYPKIKDQRFYGFKKMTFSNNFSDASFLREKVCADIFRTGGVPAARGAFYRVFVDKGDGVVYWGFYTMIEDPSDGMLDNQFNESTGNLYKPEGDAAAWTEFDQKSFIKKTNKNAGDWSDIRAALDALHSSRKNAAVWRVGLESVFYVNIFIRWLAINTAIVNWDSYGSMPQNYYIFQNQEDHGRLAWFPWDLNMSMDFESSPGGGGLTLALNDVGNDWPLIRYVMDDPIYNEQYHQELIKTLEGCMNENTLI